MNKIKNYLEEVVKEMQKVSWPSRKELVDNTIVTLVATIMISLFIFVADRVIGFVLDIVYGLV
ncbi:MAG: preprotein translocase subunit SecE [Bacteroidetes bacterium]|nr:preprotein translocase subunit SecE [Rhodothermaceae bacterium RA]RMH67405.1 MAG: preprotein translocase subunit SecE [Bacteroidota bacterium]